MDRYLDVSQEMDRRGLKKVKIWIKEADGNILSDYVNKEELKMASDLFEWGVLDFGDWDPDIDFGTYDLECRRPSDHKFKRKVLATSFYRECNGCGYSPELDGNKPEMKACHGQFTEWERLRGVSSDFTD